MLVFDQTYQQFELGTILFEGGEGKIYEVIGMPRSLAKVYKPDKRLGKEGKLTWMAGNTASFINHPGSQASIAWPERRLYEYGGNFIGYMMPFIPGAKTLLHVLNPRLRSQILPDFGLKYLLRTALNLAVTIQALHENDYVIGDLNEMNVLVNPAALVTVIDVDSFQVKEKQEGQIIFYSCPVGRFEYTPPELHGRQFKDEVRQPEHDAFSLAVLIFQLLMDGSHPFRSTWSGRGEAPALEEKIDLGWFPYHSNPHVPILPPPGLSLSVLHPDVAGLMRRCFIDGHDHPRRRPAASDWVIALKEAEKSLLTCRCGRQYLSHSERCPGCGLDSPATFAICPECFACNPNRNVYCKKCGKRLHPLAVCHHCGQPTAQGLLAAFCEVCGREI